MMFGQVINVRKIRSDAFNLWENSSNSKSPRFRAIWE
jgi:hypothetical protein